MERIVEMEMQCNQRNLRVAGKAVGACRIKGQQKRSIQFLLLLLMASVCSLSALGQSFTGHVTDANGAAIPKASITVHNDLENADVTTTTTGSGDYTVPFLKPGSYRVTASAAGFKLAIHAGLVLETDQVSTVNFSLSVGAVTESITVTGDSLVDFGKADNGEVIENTRVTEIPLNGRDPGMLSQLSAGASWNGDLKDGYTRPFDDTQAQIAVNGGGTGNVELMLDGVSNTNASINQVYGNSRIAYVPLVDSVQEFKLVTNPYDAQYGLLSGGAEDVTLKSGTNKIHGDVYEFARRTWLDSNLWVNDYNNTKALPGQTISPTPNHKLDQYGAELDGPVFVPHFYNGKDKTFFTLQYERWNEISPSSTKTSVPSPQWYTPDANGNYDFSNLVYATTSGYAPISLLDPKNISFVGGGWVRVPFGPTDTINPTPKANVIPGSRVNPVALKMLQSFYPQPNTQTAAGSNPFANNYTYTNATTNQYRNVLAKIDHNLTANDRFSLHYGYWERFEVRDGNGLLGAGESGLLPHTERSNTFTVEETHTFTPNLIFDFRSNVIVRYDNVNNGPHVNPSTIGINNPQSLGAAGESEIPWFNLSEFASPGATGSGGWVGHQLSIVPSLTWIKGKHAIRTGLDTRFMQQITATLNGGPEFDIDRTWTQTSCCGSWDPASGNSIASMLLGNATGGKNVINAPQFWSDHYWAPFIQDDWKVTPKLTLNLGVRWDIFPSETERHNATESNFSTTMVNPISSQVSVPGYSQLLGGVTYAGVNGRARGFFPTTWDNIQPRFGFAYAVDNKTAIRGGFGESMQNPQYNTPNDGFSSNTPYQGSDPNYPNGVRPYAATTFDHPFPTVIQPVGSARGALDQLGGGPWTVNSHYRPPQFWNYSFGAERQFSQRDMVNISYVGSQLFGGNSNNNLDKESISAQQACDPQLGGIPEVCINNNVANPFLGNINFLGQSYYNQTTINALNLTRPFPQYTGVEEWDENNYHTWYNALQVTAMHKMSNALTMHLTWTWSKQMDSGGWADETNDIVSRNIDGNDHTHIVTLSSVYLLPIGRGRTLLGNSNRIVDGAIGGWELSGQYIYKTGQPYGTPGNLLYNAGVKRHVQQSNGYLRLVAPCVEYYKDSNATSPWPLVKLYGDPANGQVDIYHSDVSCNSPAYQLVPTYGIQQNVVYSGVRIPAFQVFDMSASKNFSIVERMHLQIRVDAFNFPNHPEWNESGDTNAQDADFGTIRKGVDSPSNAPREVQLSAKLVW
jgi:hypothetical protein